MVSAIIPTFERAELLTGAIESVLAQRHVDVECVVVDDGSRDHTPAVIAAFGESIRSIRIPNGGPSRARNVGARLARGRWLAFLDSDDRWEPDKLSTQLRHTRGVDLVYTDRRGFGDVVPGREMLSSILRMHEGDVFEPLLLGNFIPLSSVLMKRDVFLELGGFCEDLHGSEDWDLWLRYAARRPVAFVRAPLTQYRKHEQGISRDPLRMTGTHLRVIERALALPRGAALPARQRRAARARALDATAEHAVRISMRHALHYHLRAILCGGPRRQRLLALLRCLLRRC